MKHSLFYSQMTKEGDVADVVQIDFWQGTASRKGREATIKSGETVTIR